MGWYQLADIAADHEQSVRSELSRGPSACPNCGEPLTPTPTPGSRFCRFDGYQYPRDGWGVVGEPSR